MTRQTLRTLANIIFVLLAALIFTGCASAAPEAANGGAPAAADAAGAPAAEAPPADQALAGAPTSGGMERQIIARAHITLIVGDTQQVVDQINQMLGTAGGYVANANLYKSAYGDDEVLQGTLTLRVPSAQTDPILAQLEALAVDIGDKNLNREDVTDQYTDLQAQLRNLTATEEELRALLTEVRAKPGATPDDILTVHRHVTEIRGQIDQLQGRKNMLDNLVSMATIDVTLTPDVLSQPVVKEGWRPTAVVRSALRSLVSTLEVVGTVVIWIGLYLLPLLLLVVLVAAAGYGILRVINHHIAKRSGASA